MNARILLANDDGVASEGLAVAREALIATGASVLTVAPHEPKSGTSRAATFRNPVPIHRHGGCDRHPVYAAEGTPADCVRVAMLSGLAERFDLVVSGINEGANLGDDATYSSTLGAAIEGALLGCPAIAASQQSRDGRFRLVDLMDYDFAGGTTVLVELVLAVIRNRDGLPRRSVLNLNTPGTPARGLRIAHLDERVWPDGSVYAGPRERDGASGWFVFGTHPERDPEFALTPGGDAHALAEGYAAVTPLCFDWRDARAHARLRRWTRHRVAALNERVFNDYP